MTPHKNWHKYSKGVWHLGGMTLVSIHLNGHNSVIYQARTSKFSMLVHIDSLQKLAKKIKRGVAPRHFISRRNWFGSAFLLSEFGPTWAAVGNSNLFLFFTQIVAVAGNLTFKSTKLSFSYVQKAAISFWYKKKAFLLILGHLTCYK